MDDEPEPSPPRRPRWVPLTLLTAGTVLAVAPLVYLWRVKGAKSIRLNATAPPRRVHGALPSRATFTGTPAQPTATPAPIPEPTPESLRSRFAFVAPWNDTDMSIGAPSGSKYSSSYSVSSAWKDDDDDDWGVRPGPVAPDDKFNGALYTLQAFGAATLMVAALGVGGIWGLVRYLDVDNMQDFSDKMRLEVMSKMPFLAERMRKSLNLSATDQPAEEASKPPDQTQEWSYDESQDRLSDAFDKGGVSGWASALVREVEEEAKVEMDKRERLNSKKPPNSAP
ncbi:hypothetical protein HMN09_00580000 [Mycena chlorophos]|uniref:Transmembrane protein n=1 Tax=Mycena chlorophos TaxID=658473 RepID=A0A8H6T3V6_MYCCL|nr:hypothetical protein HMN09_00580000 [Mycena chlorophos]